MSDFICRLLWIGTKKLKHCMSNSVDPDETAHYVCKSLLLSLMAVEELITMKLHYRLLSIGTKFICKAETLNVKQRRS